MYVNFFFRDGHLVLAYQLGSLSLGDNQSLSLSIQYLSRGGSYEISLFHISISFRHVSLLKVGFGLLHLIEDSKQVSSAPI